jgi:hypothetical protein
MIPVEDFIVRQLASVKKGKIRVRGMAQVVKCLPSKCEVLSSSTANKKKKIHLNLRKIFFVKW